jgi:hypothetical protein
VLTARDLTADDRERLNGYVQQIVRQGANTKALLAGVREQVEQCVRRVRPASAYPLQEKGFQVRGRGAFDTALTLYGHNKHLLAPPSSSYASRRRPISSDKKLRLTDSRGITQGCGSAG